jgi:hypothetical protein
MKKINLRPVKQSYLAIFPECYSAYENTNLHTQYTEQCLTISDLYFMLLHTQ